jgi:ABC-2 type transport system permease protein
LNETDMISIKKIRAKYNYSLILLKELVITDFKLRYQGSVLGYLWSLLRPLAIFLIMYVVFLKFLRFDYGVPHSTVYLLLGIVLWNYFTEVTSNGVGSIVGKGDLLRKINFPKYVVVLAGSFSALINLAINFVVIAIFMVFDHVAVSWHIMWAIPLVIELFILALGIAFALSAIFVKLRDMSYIWEVVLQGMFYATPIFYPLTQVPGKAAKLIMLNPAAQIIQDMRHAIVSPKSPVITTYWSSPYIRLVPIILAVLIAIAAAIYFRKRSKFFAEDI